jgi:COP9 signalosome complex subunit 4
MASFASELATLEASGGDRAAEYNNVLQRIMATTDNLEDNMVRYVQSITSDSTGVIQSRPLLSAFIEQFRALPNNDAKTEAG